MTDDDNNINNEQMEQTTCWIQRTLGEAIYGKVKQGTTSRRRLHRGAAGSNETEREVADRCCAAKEISHHFTILGKCSLRLGTILSSKHHH